MKNKGFTLIELILAMAIGLFLMGVLGRVYFNNKLFYERQQDLRAIQESARVLVYLFHNSLAQAGIQDCDSKGIVPNIQVACYQNHLIVMRCVEKKGIRRYSTVEYFIKKKALYRKANILKKSQKLVEGVQALRYEFGQACSDGKGVCHYLKESEVVDWRGIRSVLIEADLVSHQMKKTWVIYVVLPTVK